MIQVQIIGTNMRITRKQLKHIIREQLEKELYVVIGNADRGQQNMWPKSDEPEAYPKAEADRIAKDLNNKSRGGYMQVHDHAKPLNQAIKYVSPGNLAYGGLLDLMDKHGINK